jgi:2-dehydro-3-deoxyphosphooctonate aldolase (KDO 8-P synthase)
MKTIQVGEAVTGGDHPFILIAGPCVIEEENTTRDIAAFLKELTDRMNIPFIFKASYDKANRTSLMGYRGPGAMQGLEILKRIKRDFQVTILSDVHRFEEIEPAAEVLDVMQVPAFLCRQTDFIMEMAKKGKVINIKKGQFLAPWDVKNIIEKIEATGMERLMITERGASFGYNNLVADMRSIPIMRAFGYPVIFDATHSVQLPGGAGASSGGNREMIPFLARAAVAAGVDGLFFEVHPHPEAALCDGPNSLRMTDLESLLKTLTRIDRIVKANE